MTNHQTNSLSILLMSGVLAVLCAVAIEGQTACRGHELFSAKACPGDAVSGDETELLTLVNSYRKANNRPELKFSQSLSLLANRRMLDLRFNIGKLTHSWSNCNYDIADDKTWTCVMDAPRRLNTGYTGQGFETLYRTTTGNAAAAPAMESWKKSRLHNSIILNLDSFQDLHWDEVGVAIDGPYAALWFGCPGASKARERELGLGVSYEEAVEGLTKILSIDRSSTALKGDKWFGLTKDKKLKLEIYGSRQEISKARIGITIGLGADGKPPAEKLLVLLTLLNNLFPEWPDVDEWLDRSLSALAQNLTASRTKVVRKVHIELSSNGPNSLLLSVKPESPTEYYEVF